MPKKKKHKADPQNWEIERNRKGDAHIRACKSGYAASKRYRQVHHILPVSSLSDATISKLLANDKNFEFIRNCLMVTTWDINAKPNCIGLPLKRAYIEKKAPPGWDNLPCHQVDHNPYYTDEVSEDLKNNVWDPSIEAAEECEFDAANLDTELDARSKYWEGELRTRGERPGLPKGGTAYCWKHKHTKALRDSWYLPFSMAATPQKRSPPPDWDTFAGSMQKYLDTIFKLI